MYRISAEEALRTAITHPHFYDIEVVFYEILKCAIQGETQYHYNKMLRKYEIEELVNQGYHIVITPEGITIQWGEQ